MRVLNHVTPSFKLGFILPRVKNCHHPTYHSVNVSEGARTFNTRFYSDFRPTFHVLLHPSIYGEVSAFFFSYTSAKNRVHF